MPKIAKTEEQIETLTSQVATLQSLVSTLQNQQTNPASSLPQNTKVSLTTAIPVVSQVVVLSQKSGTTGTQVTIGFATPARGVNTNQINFYNIWVQPAGAVAANTNPTVVATTQVSPCTFIIPSVTSSTTMSIGVQTVMNNGSVLPFSQCPTTALTLTLAANIYTNQATGSVALTASTPTNLGNSITVGTTGTYLFWLNIQAASAGTGALTFSLNKNGGAVGNTFTLAIANNNEAILNIFSLPLVAGDVLQPIVNSSVTANFFFTIQTVLEKQFVS